MLVCAGALILVPVAHAQTNPSLSRGNDQQLTEGPDLQQDPGGQPGESGRFGHDRMGRSGEGPRPPRDVRPVELSPEDEKLLFEVLQEVNPKLVEKIKTWRKVNPERSGRMLARMFNRMQNLIHLKSMDKPMYELKIKDLGLDAQSRTLAAAYRKEPTDDAKKQLMDVLSEQFDVRQKMREHELDRLKEKISQLESQLQQRAANRQQIINKQLKDITMKNPRNKWRSRLPRI